MMTQQIKNVNKDIEKINDDLYVKNVNDLLIKAE